MSDANLTPNPKMLRTTPLNQAQANAAGATHVVVPGLPKGKRNDYLTLKDVQHGEYHIPLGQDLPTVAKGTHDSYAKGAAPNALVAFIPLVYATPEMTRAAAALPEPESWIYVFRNGKLWREIQVGREGALSDVNLTVVRQQAKGDALPDVRLPTGIGESSVIVPSKVNNQPQTIEIAISHVQWSGAQVKKLESDAAKRGRRLQKLDFSGSANGFKGSQGILGSLEEVRPDSGRAWLEFYRPSGIAVGYFADPLGIAKQLKREHATSINAIEITSERMRLSDYGLAMVIDQLLEAEKRGIEADPEVMRANSEAESARSDFDSRLRGRVRSIHTAFQAHAAAEAMQRPDELRAEKIKLAAVTDTARVKERLEYWARLDRETNDAAYRTGLTLLKFIKDTTPQVTVEAALLDYLENIGPRAAAGAALWCGLVEDLVFKEAVDYLRETAEQRNTIGACLCRPTPELRRAAQSLERSVPNQALLSDPKAAITGSEWLKLVKTSAGVVSHLLKTFSLVKLQEGKPGLKWLAKLCNDYLPLHVTVERASIAAMYGVTKSTADRGYRYLPTMGDIYDKVQVDYLKCKEVKTWGELAEAIKKSDEVKYFSFAVGMIGMFNYAQTTKALWFDKQATNQERYESVAGLVDQMAFVGNLSKFCFERAVKGWEEAAMTMGKTVPKGIADETSLLNRVGRDGSKGSAETAARILAQRGTENLRRRIIYATNTGSVLDLVTAVMGLGTGCYEFYNQFRDGSGTGMTGATLKLASSSIALTNAVRTFKWLRVVRVIQGAGVAAEAGGAATAEVGVGVAILAIGIVLDVGGSWLLRVIAKSDLEKALQFGHFGKRRYEEGYFEERTNIVTAIRDVPLVRAFGEPKVDDQLYEIYRSLYAFNGYVDMAQEGNGALPAGGQYVVRGVLEFAQFLPNRSLLECTIELHDDKGGIQVLTYPEHLKPLPATKDGILRTIKFFCRVPVEKRERVRKVVMKARLDALGDGKYVLPKDKPFDEYSFEKRIFYRGGAISYGYVGGSKNGEVVGLLPAQNPTDVVQAYQMTAMTR